MNSSFVNLSSYCIAEYRSIPVNDPAPEIRTTRFYLVENQHVNARQIYNTDGYASVTHNTRDLSVVGVGGSKVIYNDITLIPLYTEYDPLITETELPLSISTNLVMDTLRIHIASGFNFTEVENFVIGIKHKLNDYTQIQLASILLDATSASTIFTYNSKPLFIANTVYDRYVDIKIPSVPWLDQDFDQFGDTSFEWVITGGTGFIKNAPLTVYIAEAAYEEYNAPNNVTYDRYQLNNYNEGAISQVNMFDALGCHIQEAEDGDYIEFFATWNGAFPDSLIASLNDSGPDQDWIFSHQLQVYEQIGGTQVPSGNLTIYQENKFDEVLTYRPILREAGFAVAMSIDYTLRLINKKNGDQVIKTGSLSVINPNKYGKKLAKLNLPDGPQSMKVYNKIVQKNFEATSIFSPKSTHVNVSQQAAASPTTEIKTVTVKVPEYLPIKQENIKLSAKNAIHKYGNESDQVIYGQGRLVLPIDPVDNVIKFIVYEVDPTNSKKQKRVDLNNNSDFKITFGQSTDFSFAASTDATLTSPSQGEIAFKIPKDKSKLILASGDNRFFISLVSKSDSTETLLYTGTWISSADYGIALTAAEDALTSLENENTIAELKTKITELTKTNQELQDKVQSLTRTQTASNTPETPINVNTAASITPVKNIKTTVNASTSGTSAASANIKMGGGTSNADEIPIKTKVRSAQMSPSPNKPKTLPPVSQFN